MLLLSIICALYKYANFIFFKKSFAHLHAREYNICMVRLIITHFLLYELFLKTKSGGVDLVQKSSWEKR